MHTLTHTQSLTYIQYIHTLTHTHAHARTHTYTCIYTGDTGGTRKQSPSTQTHTDTHTHTHTHTLAYIQVTEEAHENTPPAHESENQGAGQMWDENDNEVKKNREKCF